MKTSTLFRAFKRTHYEMAIITSQRKGHNLGIAVDADPLAKKWRRYERLAWKLGLKIELRLAAMERKEAVQS